ncbi:unnamed protein product, partial [Ixodes hexagonus]
VSLLRAAFRRPPRPMFRGAFPPYGGFPPGPLHPRFAGPPVVPPHRPAVFPSMVRPPMGVFGSPAPPPPPGHFLRGRGGPGGPMRPRPNFRPQKFSPYPSPNKPAQDPSAQGTTKPSNGATTNGTSSSQSNGMDARAAAAAAAQRDGIPAELIQPLCCKLCDAKLNGKLQATAHYVGKIHAKKVKQYLQSKGHTATATGQRVAPTGQAQPAAGATKTPADSKKLSPDTLEKFCKLCDVAFTSEIQAKQHYDGRNHQRRLRGEPPLPKGFYNPATGRWQRQPPPGMAIKVGQARKNGPPGGPAGPNAFTCEPCNVSLTSEQQLNAHLQGAKHKARVSGLATAVTATVVTANAAAAASGFTASPHHPQQQAQPFIAFVAGSNPVCISAGGE